MDIKDWILNPKPTDLMLVIRKNPGITMTGLHQLGYKLVWDSLKSLMDEEQVFAHEIEKDEYGYYPND